MTIRKILQSTMIYPMCTTDRSVKQKPDLPDEFTKGFKGPSNSEKVPRRTGRRFKRKVQFSVPCIPRFVIRSSAIERITTLPRNILRRDSLFVEVARETTVRRCDKTREFIISGSLSQRGENASRG